MRARNDLNQMQYEAATTPGPVLVVAGAGSGKTKTLVHRIARLLSEGVPPERVLVLTFSRKAASELRRRLLTSPGGERVSALTFHAWALLRLRARGRRFRIVDRAEGRVMVRRCLRALGRPGDAASVRDVLDRVSRAKGRLEPLADPVASCYGRALADADALDLDDLIIEASHLDERGRYDHVLVDEFQDTSVAQFSLLRALTRPDEDVCVVGDEDQSIYGWRAAEPANLRRFREAFPGARLVTLARNYRSTPAILEAANAVIARDPERLPKRMESARADRGAPVLVLEAADERDEAGALSDLVGAAVAAGTPAGEIALLYRVNAQARALERALFARGIAYVVVRGVAFADRAGVRDAVALLRLVRDEDDDAAFRRLAMTLAKGIGPVAMRRLEGWGHLFPSARLGVLPPRYHAAVARIVAAVDGLRSQDGALEDLVRSAWRTLGHGDDPDTTDGELLATLLDLARDAPSLDALVDAVVVHDEPEPEAARDGVNLLTLHAAKGLEFSLVCLAGMEEGILPHRRAFEDERELAEERRLCYVGMTRAKDRLVLSYATARVALGGLSLGLPSRFLEDLPPSVVEPRRTEAARARGGPEPALAAGERVRHRRWGEGTVEKLETIDGARYVTIRFADRTRRMRSAFAPLEPLG